MSASVNKVILVGNVGKDPEIRRTQDGKAIANLSVATSETWCDKTTGERKERTEWHRVVIFNEALAKIAGNDLRKGSKVYIEGQLQTRKWMDQSGTDRYVTEVVLQGFGSHLVTIGGNKQEPDTCELYANSSSAKATPGPSVTMARQRGRDPISTGRDIRPTDDDMDDDIPF